MSSRRPPLEEWLDEIKSSTASRKIGVFFTHSGVVRGTSRDGSPVAAMEVACDGPRLAELVERVAAMPGVIGVRAWVNEGSLAVGDDIVWALVAGDVRTNAFTAWEVLSHSIKHECTVQREILESQAA